MTLFQGVVSLWDKDKDFISLYKSVRKDILIDKKSAYVIYKSIKHCSHLKGDFAELGVYKGAVVRLLSSLNINNKKIYGFDTFEGFPEHDKSKNPTWTPGGLNIDLELVKNKINDPNVILIKGFFPNSADALKSKT